MKNIKIRKKIVVLLISVVLVVTLSIVPLTNKEPEKEILVVAKIEDYDYKLKNNQTKIYKKYFSDLEEELKDNKINEENYAKLIAKLFLIDFYTLSNKMTNQDIGGVQFIYSNKQDNFKLKATETIYKYVQTNIYGNRSQKLPTVKDVEIVSLDTIKFSYLEQEDNNAYQIKSKISYKEDMNYPKDITLTIIHEDNKLVIAEVK